MMEYIFIGLFVNFQNGQKFGTMKIKERTNKMGRTEGVKLFFFPASVGIMDIKEVTFEETRS